MNNFPPKSVGLGIDAVPQKLKVNVNENVINPEFPFESLVDGFSEEDYKSAFFLLMDDVGTKNFISLTNQDLPHLKAEFIKICRGFNEAFLIELFGTLKMYKKLKLFNTCFHIYENKRDTFSKIEAIWKVLYTLCEEMTDDDVKSLKQKVPENSRNYIQSAEDWFCWALNENVFSRANLSPLETIFREYPNFLNIIRSLKDYAVYPLKVPSSSSHCGIALILNYEIFNENSKLEQRLNSDKDVEALKKLWKSFGFSTKDYKNLNRSESFKIIRDCASWNHSSFGVFVCCILSHGKSNAVFSSDGHLMEISKLIKPISNDCVTLQGKPKLFFIQACQGPYIHQGAGKQVYCTKELSTKETVEPEGTVSAPPIHTDTLISCSSIDGYVSFRDDKGSWFIQTLCKKMEQYGDNSSIEDVLKKVNEEVSNKYSANFGFSGLKKALQMPEYRSSFKKTLILKKCSK